MTTHKEPAVICDRRLFCVCRKIPQTYSTQRLLIVDCANARSGNHLGGDPADAGAGETHGAGGAGGEVEDAAADKRAAVVDGDDDAAVAVGHSEFGAERQAAVSRGHGVLVEARSGGGLAAGFVAVKGGHAREAVAAADRSVGIAPGRIAGVMGMVAVMMMPRFSRGFGDAPTKQESSGEQCDRSTRPG